jgi:hypothetical protein
MRSLTIILAVVFSFVIVANVEAGLFRRRSGERRTPVKTVLRGVGHGLGHAAGGCRGGACH